MDIAELGLKAESSDIQTATQRLDALERSAGKAETASGRLEKQVAKMKKELVQIGAGLASLEAVRRLLAAAFDQARQFRAGMAEVATLLDDTSGLDAQAAALRQLAKNYGTSAVGQVKAYYQAISAGAKQGEEALNLLSIANRTAIAGVTETATAVDILTTATNAYADKNLTAQQASDALFVGMRAGKTTVGELAAGLGRVIPSATAVGLSFDSIVAASAALTTQGQNTNMAMTGLTATISGVIRPTAQAAELAKELGLEFNSTALEALGLSKFMQEVVEKTGGSRDQIATLFGSTEALRAVFSLAGEGGKKFNEILEQMAFKAGETDKAFQKISATADAELNRLGSEIADQFITAGDAMLDSLQPAITWLADNMVSLVGTVSTLAQVILTVLVARAGAALLTWLNATAGAWVRHAAAALSANAAMGAGALATNALTVATRGFSVALAAVGGPLGLVVLGLGALAAAVYDSIQAEQARLEQERSSITSLAEYAESLRKAREERELLSRAEAQGISTAQVSAVEQTTAAVEKLNKAQMQLNELREGGIRAIEKGAEIALKSRIEELSETVDQAGDAFRRLGQELVGQEDAFEQAQGMFSSLRNVRVPPALAALGRALRGVSKEAEAADEAVESLSTTIGDDFTKELTDATNALKVQLIELQNGRREALLWEAVQKTGASSVANLTDEIVRQIDERIRLEKSIEAATAAQERAEEVRRETIAQLEREAQAYADQQIAQAEALSTLHQLVEQLDREASQVGLTAEEVGRLTLQRQLDRLEAQIGNDVSRETVEQLKREAIASYELRVKREADFKAITEAQDEQHRLSIEYAREQERAWLDFSRGMAEAILEGTDSVKGYFKSLWEDLKRQLIQSGILNLMRAVFGAGGGGGLTLAASGGAGQSLLGTLFSGFGGGSSSSSGFSFTNLLGSGAGSFSQLLYGSGQATALGSTFGTAVYGPGMATQWAPTAAGTVGLAAAGLGGAYYGYQQSGNLAGAVGYGALGLGAAGAVGGVASGAGAIAGATGAFSSLGASAAIPVIGWIAAIAALVDMFSGGKLFGTKYRPESSTSTIGIGADGGFAEEMVTEVRQRSLFRGRQWRDSSRPASEEAVDAANQLYDSIYGIMTSAAEQLAIDTPPAIDAAIRTVMEYDKKGKVTATKMFVDILGESIEVASGEEAASRIVSESIIAVIDAALGGVTEVANDPGTFGDAAAAGAAGGRGFGEEWGRQFHKAAVDSSKGATMAVVGEASALAERWRGDTQLLADGAQFLLAAAVDIRNGTALLGEGSTLTEITNLTEELQVGGETLIQTYSRMAISTALFETALDRSGQETSKTREELLRFSVAMVDAAGGLDNLGALWNNYFDLFFTQEEKLSYAVDQARTSTAAAFDRIGLDFEDFDGATGMADFRTNFEALMDTLSPEDTFKWLQAAAALGMFNQVMGKYGAFLGVAAQNLADLMAGVDAQLAEYAPPPTFEERIAAVNDNIGRLIARARELGASEEEINRIRRLGQLQLGAIIDEQNDALLAQVEAAQAQAIAARSLNELMSSLARNGWSAPMQALIDLDAQFQQHVATIQRLARESGRASASQSELLMATRWYQRQLRAMAGELRDTVMQLLGQLGLSAVQTELTGGGTVDPVATELNGIQQVNDAIDDRYQRELDALRSLEEFVNSLNLSSISPLTPNQRLEEAQSEYERLLALYQETGDADVLRQLQQAAQNYLGEASDYYGGVGAFPDIFNSVRDTLLQLIANGPINQPPEEAGLAPTTPVVGGPVTVNPGDGFQAMNERERALLTQQLVDNLAAFAIALNVPILQLVEELNIPLQTLAENLGANLDELTGQSVAVLAQLAYDLGLPLGELVTELGLNLPDLADGVRELATEMGINLDELTTETALGLAGLASTLNTDLATLTTSLGIDLGRLTDANSPIFTALQATIDQLSPDIRDRLNPLLQGIATATTEADANAAIQEAEDAINGLPVGIRDLLAPYFDGVFPAGALTDLDYLGTIEQNTFDAQLSLLNISGAIDYSNVILEAIELHLREAGNELPGTGGFTPPFDPWNPGDGGSGPTTPTPGPTITVPSSGTASVVAPVEGDAVASSGESRDALLDEVKELRRAMEDLLQRTADATERTNEELRNAQQNSRAA